MDRSSQTNIKAVILDYGEVLSYPPMAEEWSRMASVFHVEPSRFRVLWGQDRLAYDRGDLSLEAYWSMLAEEVDMKLEPELLKQLSQWDNEMWARINPPIVEWAKRMQSSGVKTGLLSNMPVSMIQYARKNFGWLSNFDHQTFSAEVRVVKPDAAIYQHSIDGLKVAASEALFVDDRATNVEGARAVGLKAIQFRSVTQLGDDLGELGFPVLPADSALPS